MKPLPECGDENLLLALLKSDKAVMRALRAELHPELQPLRPGEYRTSAAAVEASIGKLSTAIEALDATAKGLREEAARLDARTAKAIEKLNARASGE